MKALILLAFVLAMTPNISQAQSSLDCSNPPAGIAAGHRPKLQSGGYGFCVVDACVGNLEVYKNRCVGAPSVRWFSVSRQLTEGEYTIALYAVLSRQPSSRITLPIKVSGSSATIGRDYELSSQAVVFDSSVSNPFLVTIHKIAGYQPNREILLEFDSSSLVSSVPLQGISLSITDSEPPQPISASLAVVNSSGQIGGVVSIGDSHALLRITASAPLSKLFPTRLEVIPSGDVGALTGGSAHYRVSIPANQTSIDVNLPISPAVAGFATDSVISLRVKTVSAPAISSSTSMLIQATGFSLMPSAPQLMHQNSVPHTDKVGNSLSTYQAGSSFFPIWAYGNKHPSTNYLCHPDEAAKKWDENNPSDSTRYSNVRVLKEAHFNTGQFWGGYPEYSDFFLNESKRLGMQVLFYWQPLDDGLTARTWDSWSAYHNTLDYITRNGADSNILGWIPTEETGRYFSKPQKSVEGWVLFYHSLIDQIRSLSPKSIFILENLWVSNQTEKTLVSNDPDGTLDVWSYFHWRDNVAAIDDYVPNLKSLQTFDYSNGLSRAGQFVSRMYGETRPYWSMINVFEEYDSNGSIANGNEFPSPVQLRDMVYISIVHGATGVAYFAPDDFTMRQAHMVGVRPDTPTSYLQQGYCAGLDMLSVSAEKAQESITLWNTISEINSEIEQLSPVLLTNTSSTTYSVYASGTAISTNPIRTMLKEFNGAYYLFVTNLDKSNLKIRVAIDALSSGSQAQVLFENRGVSATNTGGKTWIADDIGEFGVHVYRVSKP
jgi:hypothetical protein